MEDWQATLQARAAAQATAVAAIEIHPSATAATAAAVNKLESFFDRSVGTTRLLRRRIFEDQCALLWFLKAGGVHPADFRITGRIADKIIQLQQLFEAQSATLPNVGDIVEVYVDSEAWTVNMVPFGKNGWYRAKCIHRNRGIIRRQQTRLADHIDFDRAYESFDIQFMQVPDRGPPRRSEFGPGNMFTESEVSNVQEMLDDCAGIPVRIFKRSGSRGIAGLPRDTEATPTAAPAASPSATPPAAPANVPSRSAAPTASQASSSTAAASRKRKAVATDDQDAHELLRQCCMRLDADSRDPDLAWLAQWARNFTRAHPEEGENECIVCFAEGKTHALSPCGHFNFCEPCARKIVGAGRQCPICAKPADGVSGIRAA